MHLRTFTLNTLRRDDSICIVKASDVVFLYLIAVMKWKIVHGKWLEVTDLRLLPILIQVVIPSGH